MRCAACRWPERSAQTGEADSLRVHLAHGICVHAGHERCAARENVRLQGSLLTACRIGILRFLQQAGARRGSLDEIPCELTGVISSINSPRKT
jgi:hypothetical protein